MNQKLITLTLATLVLVWHGGVSADENRHDVEKALTKPIVNGGNVYKQHCESCHGKDGRVGMKTSNPRHFNDNGQYLRIISKGQGKMPPWKDVLTRKEIQDVIAYINVLGSPEKRGESVFKTHCVQCHGTKGRGDGPAAKFYTPRPANLSVSDKNDTYKEMIIRMGGEAMGRSNIMPSWEKMLSDQEIADVIKFLKTLL
ncbi:MAG: c-type cytochrome [Gammaproteobacteria bacterium]|nr:c-type cytochrome [Gammaproteobacteria bacterium]MDH5801390.1 c-type cytochrome [Gammaproteobacteria bacterium]